jgi:RNA polymerase sigma-70 factor (ECF subfamily)
MTEKCNIESDAELVERTLAGDVRASALLVRRHLEAVRRVFANKVAEPEAVDDLTQETLLGCFARLSSLARPECFRAWMLAIARHKLHNYYRALGRARQRIVRADDSLQYACDRSDAVIRAIEAQDDERMLAAALSRLSRDSQLLVLQRYWHERSRGEIAAALGIPAGTVGSRLWSARKQLGELISAFESDRDALADATHGSNDTGSVSGPGSSGSCGSASGSASLSPRQQRPT